MLVAAPVRGDGRCLFRAVVRGRAHNGGRLASRLTPSGGRVGGGAWVLVRWRVGRVGRAWWGGALRWVGAPGSGRAPTDGWLTWWTVDAWTAARVGDARLVAAADWTVWPVGPPAPLTDRCGRRVERAHGAGGGRCPPPAVRRRARRPPRATLPVLCARAGGRGRGWGRRVSSLLQADAASKDVRGRARAPHGRPPAPLPHRRVRAAAGGGPARDGPPAANPGVWAAVRDRAAVRALLGRDAL